jgi:hypothetical protein
MHELKSYTGTCRCGAVRFEASTDLRRVFECCMSQSGPYEPWPLVLAWEVGVYLRHAFDCVDYCSPGWLITLLAKDRFKHLAGEVDDQGFCRECRTYTFGHGVAGWAPECWAINVRALERVLDDVPASPEGHIIGMPCYKVLGVPPKYPWESV